MGQKVNPIGIRIGVNKTWNSVWYANNQQFADNVYSDHLIRSLLNKKFKNASVDHITIERTPQYVKLIIHSARPGIIIGKKGERTDLLSSEISTYINSPVRIDVKEIKKPDLYAKLVADSIAYQLEKRVMFRRAIKKAIQATMKAGAQGVKIAVAGRLNGAEIARTEWFKEGRIPLHVFRADIDYALSEAHTVYGIIGVKVWIFTKEIMKQKKKEVANVTT